MDPKIQPETALHKKSSHVPGQYLGYSLQATRFLIRLLQEDPDSFVSLEVFEDVGIETPQGYKIAEQDKSTNTGNPVHDRSIELWKTFSNWVSAVASGELIIGKTLFEIYTSHPKTGRIIQSFSEAKTTQEAVNALRQAKNILWGPEPKYSLRETLPRAIRPYIDNVFNLDEPLVSQIIQAFTLISGTGSPQNELRALLSKNLILPEFTDEVLKYALGWVKEQTDLLLEQKKPVAISVNKFRINLSSFVRKLFNRAILNTYARNPTQEEIDTDLSLRVYVRQLELIKCDDTDKIRAVTDFLKASSERTQWSEKGLVHESSFNEFEDELVRTWQNLRKKGDITLSGRDEVQKGQYLYAECSEHQSRLEGLEVPRHFTPGSFHALSDDEIIGWHPDYKNRLKKIQRRP